MKDRRKETQIRPAKDKDNMPTESAPIKPKSQVPKRHKKSGKTQHNQLTGTLIQYAPTTDSTREQKLAKGV